MAVRALKNQYLGINAHLHSYWQHEGGWDSFHALHIGDLTKLLNSQLLPMGYMADIQQSLQIRRAGEPAGKPESDVTIYDRDPVRSRQPAIPADTHQMVLSVLDVMDVEEEIAEYTAIGLYEFDSNNPEQGNAVAWIELLSPSNKPGRQDAVYYRNKRLKLLEGGMVFVEIDYLHESPPTFNKLPRYQTKRQPAEPESHPYRIVVVDPRPTLIPGKVLAYQFDVDEKIPTVDIPLSAGDVLHFDFGKPYKKTFEEMLYGLQLVDYDQLPVNIDRYSPSDQMRIVTRLLTIKAAVEQGKELGAPLPILKAPDSLEAGLVTLKK